MHILRVLSICVLCSSLNHVLHNGEGTVFYVTVKAVFGMALYYGL